MDRHPDENANTIAIYDLRRRVEALELATRRLPTYERLGGKILSAFGRGLLRLVGWTAILLGGWVWDRFRSMVQGETK